MSNFIPVETPAGKVWVEVDTISQSDQIELASKAEDAMRTFSDTVHALRKNAESILDELQAIAPKEIDLEFSIKVGAEAGVPIFGLAKVSGEGNYTVKLKWKFEDNSPTPTLTAHHRQPKATPDPD